MNLRPDLWNWL